MKEKFFILLRAICTFAGSMLLGRAIFHQDIDNAFIEGATGVLISGASVYWSIKEKCATIEMIQGAVRQTISFLCGILVSSGFLKAESATQLIALFVATIPVIQSMLAQEKSKQLDSGKLQTDQLKKS